MAKSRNYTLDLVKLICAFGVISIHIPSDTPSADYIGSFFHPFCVPFFYVASLTYFIKGVSNAPLNQQLLKIWQRLVVPLWSWTTIYLILMCLKKLLVKDRLNLDFVNAYFYGQSAVQLYYLPSLILMQLYALSVYLLINNVKIKKLNGLVLLALCIIFHIVGYHKNCFSIETFAFYPLLVLIGLLMSLKLKKQIFMKRSLVAFGISLCITTLLIDFNIIPLNSVFPFSPYLVLLVGGLGLFLVAIDLPSIKETKISSKIMSTSYGIYLSHVVFLESLQFFIVHFLHQKLLYTFSIKLLMTLVIFTMSLLFTLLTSQISFLRFLLYGEKQDRKKIPALAL